MSATSTHADRVFSLEVEPDRDVVRVRPSGETDLDTACSVREPVRRVFELTGVAALVPFVEPERARSPSAEWAWR